LAVLVPIADLALVPAVALAAALLWLVRRVGMQRTPLCRAALSRIGVLPVRRHYYEPFVCPADLLRPLEEERELPGIDWNLTAQRELLQELRYAHELTDLTAPKRTPLEFRLGNGSFESGDAEFLYQWVRALKPRRVIEIGSGQSTLLVRRAILKNQESSAAYQCSHLCIEPFEAPWLESSGATVVRKKVEDLDPALFRELEDGDLLFIDSSHVIRPQGDVLREYLQILPTLRAGVVVHVHDVFTPRDYPREWVIDRRRLWNEQYLLEAFLSENSRWRIVAALNLLARRFPAELQRVCPYLTPDREPGSFYMRRVG
jgi:Methyltransferase domain